MSQFCVFNEQFCQKNKNIQNQILGNFVTRSLSLFHFVRKIYENIEKLAR